MKRGIVLGITTLAVVAVIITVRILSRPDVDLTAVVMEEATISEEVTILPDNVIKEAAAVNAQADSIFEVAIQEEGEAGEAKVQEIHIDFDQVKNRKETTGESHFSKSYKLILENLKVSSVPKKIRITFDREVEDITSVVILGQDGETQIQNIRFNDEALPVEGKTLFKNDWYRSEQSFSLLSEVEFVARAKDQGALSVYLQVVGE